VKRYQDDVYKRPLVVVLPRDGEGVVRVQLDHVRRLDMHFDVRSKLKEYGRLIKQIGAAFWQTLAPAH
jgi:hypothetical protein